LQTKSILDVRTVAVVAALVGLVSFSVWSIGLWLTSTQSLQNQIDDLITQKQSLQTQVTNLQNQVASLNTQLAEKQNEIEDLEARVTAYRKNIATLFEQLYGYGQSGGAAHGALPQ